MNLKVVASLALAIVAAPGLSLAAPQTWYIHNAALEDSGVDAGTITGSFDYDADTNTYSNIHIEQYSIANALVKTYDDAFTTTFSANNASNLNVYPSGEATNTRPAVRIEMHSPMTSATGTQTLSIGGKAYRCDSTFPSFCNISLDSLYFKAGAVVSTSSTPPSVTPPASIPTMTEWAMILLTIMLGGAAAITINRRRQAS
ncbi:hypothetical protein D3C72_1006110 [compost metagenome]